MKLIKMKNGFVNADMIESFAIIEHESCCDIVAYSPSYGGDCESYVLGQCAEENKVYRKLKAYQRLRALVEWLTDGESGIFDVMHIWESDNDD